MDVILGAIGVVVAAIIGIAFMLYRMTKNYQKYGPDGVKKMCPVIVEVKYMGPVSTEVKRGGFMGAMVGNFLLGDLGLLVGGLAPRGSKTLYRFAVKYDNGKVVMEDCYKDSGRYDVLMRFVDWDDL